MINNKHVHRSYINNLYVKCAIINGRVIVDFGCPPPSYIWAVDTPSKVYAQNKQRAVALP